LRAARLGLCRSRPAEGAAPVPTRMPTRRAQVRALLEWTGSMLALYEEQ
jgi:hypothetical protein